LPQCAKAIDLVGKLEADGEAYDANDMLYAFESSADYDPAPKLNSRMFRLHSGWRLRPTNWCGRI
jgi:hypothetical protein